MVTSRVAEDEGAERQRGETEPELARRMDSVVGVLIRPAVKDDARAIADIYNLEVETSTVTFDLRPRTLEEQEAWLEERSGAYVVLVAVDDSGDVIGFGSLSPYKSRPGYSTTVEDSVYVRRDQHGRGVGRAILEALVEAAKGSGFHVVMARIVGGHEASIGLHSTLGFEIVGHERQTGRKFNQWFDVILMERLLDGP